MSENIEEKKVLALKYRPHRFEDLVGQSTVSQTLSLALDSNRLSHAYLFSGLRGSGKTSTARIMAKALLCSEGPTSKPCEVCDNCVSANSNRHLDIIEMDAASNRGIDDIKDLIEHTKYKPSSARFKVFIIDEVHMLTTQAFNALLKTLEEPPGFVKFILATTDPLKLPATILSRTQHFRFNKISNTDVIHHLSHILNEENIDFETDALEILSRSGQGSLRDTLTMLDQAIIFSKGKVTTGAVVDMLGLIDPQLMDNIFSILLSSGDINPILKDLESYEVSQVCDEMTIYLKHKMLEKDSRFGVLLYDRFFRIISDAKHLLSINSDGSFVLILTLMKLIEATKLKTIDEIINQVEKVHVDESTEPVKTVEAKINKEEVQVEEIVKQAVIDEKPMPFVQGNVNSLDKDNPFEESSQEDEKKFETKIEEASQEDIVLANEVTVDLGIIDAVETEGFITPFDEGISVQNKPEEKVVSTEEVISVESHEEQTKYDPKLEVEVEAIVPELKDEPEEKDEKYTALTSKIYDRDYSLGECFEKNFVFDGFSENKLHIISYAKDEDRKFLYKHFSLIRTFAQDIYGNEIDLEFTKAKDEDIQKKNDENLENESKTKVLEENSNDTSSMIEDEQMSAGCVADMHKSSTPTPAQSELQINDILNSGMLNKAKELFDIKKITVKTRS
jgi:DNA polymerase-3 subunit gamma/tau